MYICDLYSPSYNLYTFYKLLQKIIESDYTFKIITIEHDAYLGDNFITKEQIPQRELLKSKGYQLICSDVSHAKNPDLFFEDWWVDPKYFQESDLVSWSSDKTSCDKIFERLNSSIDFSINLSMSPCLAIEISARPSKFS